MTREPRSKGSPSGPVSREDRLKAALKANMGRRKAQARARAAEDGPEDAADPRPGDATGPDNDKE